MRFYTLLTVVYLSASSAWAQEADAYKFAPPPPPALEDYDEIEDDGFENGDDTFRPPPPPMPGQQVGGPAPGFGAPGTPPPPPPPDFRNSGSYISQPGKFRFKIVDGEFWEKGKKRSRGRQMMGRSAQ